MKKDSRPTLIQIYLQFASLLSERSSCERGKVGALVTTPDLEQILSIGYNGTIKGFPNKCDDKEREGNCGCIHAEMNALVKMSRCPDAVLFLTHSPCPQCTKLVINSGIRKIYFLSYYRIDTTPLLKKIGIICKGPHIMGPDNFPVTREDVCPKK